MFCISFKISKSWPATETTELHHNTMYLPASLISVSWGTTKADKCYRLSFDLFTAAVDRDGQARTNKACNQNVPICTLKIKTKCNNRLYFIPYSTVVQKKWIILTPKILLLQRNGIGVNLLFTFFQHHYLTKQGSSFIRLTHSAYQMMES